MKKPIIGITPLFNLDVELMAMQPTYIAAIRRAGGIPVVIPFEISEEEAQILDKSIDGYVFTGGPDINPKYYGEETLECCQKIVDCRDNFEMMFIDVAYKSGKPILGICRGSQLINTYLGGSLYQDLPTQFSNEVVHTNGSSTDMALHDLTILEGTPFYEMFQSDRMRSNSFHHQGVKVLAPSLKPMCKADDGLIEAFYCPDRKFLIGTQWHPEKPFEGNIWSDSLWNRFIDAAR